MLQAAFFAALRYRSRFAACLWTFTMCSTAVAVNPSTAFNFNGPDTTWQTDDGDKVGRVMSHRCTSGGARDAAGCEQIVVAAPGGESVRLVCPTAPVVVIDELAVRIWVKASRPDIQLAARVALPRTVHDGSPSARVTVRGDRYERPGHWQQLVLKNVPKQLATQVRILRSASDAEIDSREAYVDAVVLIVPGDPQGVEVSTDDLVVDGVVRNVSDDIRQTSYPAAQGTPSTVAPAIGSTQRLPDRAGAAMPPAEETAVRLHGDLLLVDGTPFLPRAIQYQGEPLQTLAERGFNTVWLNRTPTAEEVAAARKFGLWFIGLPPHPETLSRDGIGQPDDRVIAWFLEDSAIENDVNYVSRWANLVRERDAVAGRPVITVPYDHWSSASKSADVLLAARPRLGFMLSAEYDVWLESRMRLVRPGMPLWACFPSQLGPAVGRQISVLSGGATAASPNVPSPQLQSLVEVACTRGVRGFAFHSDTALSETDAATRARACGLELINRRLQRLEPWLASGKVFGRFPSADAAWDGIVLDVEGAQLLIPVANAAALESTPASARNDVVFIVPGVPESSQVYLLTPVALKSLPVQRIAGGTRVTFRPNDDTFVLLTEDPKVVQSVRQHMIRYGNRVVGRLRESAALNAAAVAEMAPTTTQNGVKNDAAAEAASIAALLQQLDTAVASQRFEQAYLAGMAANKTLDQSAVALQRAVVGPTKLYSNPLALSGDTLAEFASFERARPGLQFGDNLLYGGDFEDVGQLTQIGWQHFQSQAPGVAPQAELSVAEPRHGRYCLMLHAAASSESRPDADIPSVWIESPPIAATAGQILEIAGWARVDPHGPDSGDGLQIVDSVGGPELALAVRHTNGWERFQIIRAIPETCELRLTFALSGYDTAQIDAVMVRPIERPSVRRLPILTPANGAEASSPLTAGPLFVAPQSPTE